MLVILLMVRERTESINGLKWNQAAYGINCFKAFKAFHRSSRYLHSVGSLVTYCSEPKVAVILLGYSRRAGNSLFPSRCMTLFNVFIWLSCLGYFFPPFSCIPTKYWQSDTALGNVTYWFCSCVAERLGAIDGACHPGLHQ